MNKPKQGEYRSAVYTDRPDYADFDAPHKFQAIESIILKRLREHPKAICSYSGGSDARHGAGDLGNVGLHRQEDVGAMSERYKAFIRELKARMLETDTTPAAAARTAVRSSSGSRTIWGCTWPWTTTATRTSPTCKAARHGTVKPCGESLGDRL